MRLEMIMKGLKSFYRNLIRKKAKYLYFEIIIFFIVLLASLSMVQVVLRYSTEDFGMVSLYYDTGKTKAVFDRNVVINKRILSTGGSNAEVYFQIPFWKVNDLQVSFNGIQNIQVQEFRLESIGGIKIDLKQKVNEELFTCENCSMVADDKEDKFYVVLDENAAYITGINLKIFSTLLAEAVIRSLVISLLLWIIFLAISGIYEKKYGKTKVIYVKLLGCICIILLSAFVLKMLNQKEIEESAIIPTDTYEEDSQMEHYTAKFCAQKSNAVVLMVDQVQYSSVSGSAKYRITDMTTGEEIIDRNVSASEIIYGGGMKIDLSEFVFQRGHEYTVDIYLARWTGFRFKQYEEGMLYSRVIYRFNSHNIGYCLVVGITLLAIALLFGFSGVTAERRFVTVSFVLGLLFVFIIPPFSGSDEIRHLSRAYTLTEKNENIIEDSKEYVGSGSGISLDAAIFPKQLSDLRLVDDGDDYDNQSYLAERSEKVNWSRFKNTILEDCGDETALISMWGVDGISFICYLPQMLFILIWNFLDLPAFGIIYAARVGNLIFTLILCWLSLRMMPERYKDIVVAACFIPNMLAIRSTCGLDGILAAVCLLFIAYVMKLRMDETDIQWKHILVMGGLMLVIALIKLPYIVIGFLVFILRGKNFLSIKRIGKKMIPHKWILGACIIICIAGFAVMWQYISGLFMRGGSNILGSTHIEYILQYPQNVIALVWKFIVCETIPYLLQGISIQANLLLGLTEGACLLICAFRDQSRRISGKEKRIIWGTVFWMILALFLVGFSLMTPGTQELTEISGRYYLPIIPVAALAGVSVPALIYKIKNYLGDMILSISFASLLYCFYIYWV